MDTESNNIPKTNQIKTIINKTDSSFMPTELIASIMIVLISDKDKNLEYMPAVMSSIMIGAVFPASIMTQQHLLVSFP